MCAKHTKPEERKETKIKRRICEWNPSPVRNCLLKAYFALTICDERSPPKIKQIDDARSTFDKPNQNKTENLLECGIGPIGPLAEEEMTKYALK